ncbi:MAG: anti-anti-sigma factor [Gammaproteobacteria bacterium SG8_11]|nr:MAG: anti-anti-sigma factor [Gammaproteobacteria bacterium SG8_11]
MSIKTDISKNEDTLTISIDGKFDFGLLKEFRQAYSTDNGPVSKYVVDMRRTETMDSSALGMLLNMKKFLNKQDREIRIINCGPTLKKILLIARFDKKFRID